MSSVPLSTYMKETLIEALERFGITDEIILFRVYEKLFHVDWSEISKEQLAIEAGIAYEYLI